MTIMNNGASELGRALYHAAWERVGEVFYDVERLKDWVVWEHKFDHLIDSEETARRFIGEMLASLNDRYTRILDDEQVAIGEENRNNTVESCVFAKRIRGNVGYLRIFTFEQLNITDQVAQAMAAIADCDGFIVDLRDNSGGNMKATAGCGDLFVEVGGIFGIETRLSNGLIQRREIGCNSEALISVKQVADRENEVDFFERHACVTAGKPVAVLINGATASSAEALAAAILENGRQAGLAVAIGEKTWGKGIGQTVVRILGKLSIKISNSRFFSPSGVWFGDARQTVCNAIEPDIAVVDDKDCGKHPVLDAALNWLTSVLVPLDARNSGRFA